MEIRNTASRYAVEEGELTALVNSLASKDGMIRQHAREQLARIGKPAVEALIGALDDHRERVRWEAAKSLMTIADSRAASALVKHLQDDDFDVRWLAAQALIALQEESLPALLNELQLHADRIRLREGAHHVLAKLRNGQVTMIIKPVLDALNRLESELTVPVAAKAAMQALQRQ